MKNFKLIDKNGVVRESLKVQYSFVDTHLKIKPTNIIDMMQNIAVFHGELAGYDIPYLRNNNIAWIIKSWIVEFENFPKISDDIILETWTNAFSKLQANRFFHLYNEAKEVLVRGSSRWFLMDTEKRKPKKIAHEFFDSYVPSDKKPATFDMNFDIDDIKEAYLNSQVKFSVTNRDIDTNNHVNNVSYIQWAFDVLPNDINSNSLVKKIKVDYIKEAFLHSNIVSNIYVEFTADGKLITVVHKDDDIKTTYAKVQILFV